MVSGLLIITVVEKVALDSIHDVPLGEFGLIFFLLLLCKGHFTLLAALGLLLAWALAHVLAGGWRRFWRLEEVRVEDFCC